MLLHIRFSKSYLLLHYYYLRAIFNCFKRKFSVCAFWPTLGFYGQRAYYQSQTSKNKDQFNKFTK
jgi:hypothetical protein